MFEDVSGGVASSPGTVVGANVKLTGTISDVNDIVIHGTVEGEVISDKTVTITETASVKGPITAQMVSVSGKVNGGVTAHQKLELLPTADVSGSISTRELIIKSGAMFNGKSAMQRDENGGKVAPAKDTEESADDVEDMKAKPADNVEQPETLPTEALTAPAVELEN